MSGVYLLEYSLARPHHIQLRIIRNHSKRSDWSSFAIFPLNTSVWAEGLGYSILKCAPQFISDVKRGKSFGHDREVTGGSVASLLAVARDSEDNRVSRRRVET